MKRTLLAAAICAALPALGATLVTDTPGPHDLYRGTKKLASYPTHDGCVAAAAARATSILSSYFCKTSATVAVVLAAGPKPADETQVVPCTDSSATWQQTRTYLSAPAPTYWTASPWLPATPPAGACPPPAPPPPAPPPMTMHGGLAVDESTIPAPQAGVFDERIASWTALPPRSAEYPKGQFRTVCFFSHYGFDDPIVHPGVPGSSHLHAFFGNGSTDANSTLATLREGSSTCRGGTINQTAYWQPAMFDVVTKRVIPAPSSILYYKVGEYVDATKTTAFPEGFKMVAGDPNASAPMQYGPASFSCDGNAVGTDNTFPFVPDPRGPHTLPSMADCPAGHEIHASVVFPNCWDGVNLDSPDHRSHMVYSWGPVNGLYLNACPADHPVLMPTITIKAIYPIQPGDNTANWRLTSDTYDPRLPGGYSLHADWFNAWKPAIMDTWIQKCLQAGNDCSAHMLGDGRVMDEFGGN